MMCISSANKISSASQRKGDRKSNTQLKKWSVQSMSCRKKIKLLWTAYSPWHKGIKALISKLVNIRRCYIEYVFKPTSLIYRLNTLWKKKRRIGLETRKLKILKTAENDRSGSWTVLKDQVTNLTISENGKKQVRNWCSYRNKELQHKRSMTKW